MLETWDLHYGQARPQLTTWVSHWPITSVRLNKAGSLAIVSSQSRAVSLLQLSWGLVTCSAIIKKEREAWVSNLNLLPAAALSVKRNCGRPYIKH